MPGGRRTEPAYSRYRPGGPRLLPQVSASPGDGDGPFLGVWDGSPGAKSWDTSAGHALLLVASDPWAEVF